MVLSLYDTAPQMPLQLRIRILGWRLHLLAASLIHGYADADASIEAEFKKVIERENATISKICFSYAGSAADYEDLRQDALINIWRGMKKFRGDASQRTWIYRVTVNSCITCLRKLSRHSHESLDELYGLIDCDDDNKESIEELHRVIDTLGRQEKAMIMMWLDELSYEEIAETMGLNRNTVATRLRRIKEKISKLYKMEECL